MRATKLISNFILRNTSNKERLRILGGYSRTLSYRIRIVVVNFVVRPKS